METIKCTSCGATVLSTDKFCKQCGKSIEQIAKCTSCGETVLSTDKFCKQCGKPNIQTTEQKTETVVAAENPNKKYVLTFDALEQNLPHEVLYSIEVDDMFIGKLEPGEKLETFVRKGIHSVTLKQSFNLSTLINYLLFREKKLETLVENNQIILLMYDREWGRIKYSIIDPSTQEQQRKEIKEKDKKEGRKIATRMAVIIACIILVVILIALIFQ